MSEVQSNDPEKDLNKIVEVMRFIHSPFEVQSTDSACKSWKKPETKIEKFDDILSQLIDAVRNVIRHKPEAFSNDSLVVQSDPPSMNWEFVLAVLDLLDRLREILEDLEKDATTTIEPLSIQAQLYLKHLIKSLLNFGIYPYIYPGLWELADPSRKNMQQMHALVKEDMSKVPPFLQFFRLSIVVKRLVAYANQKDMFHCVTQDNLTVIIAAAYHIGWAKIAPPKEKSCSDGNLTKLEYDCVCVIQKELKNIVKSLLFLPDVSSLIDSHVILLSSKKVPKWFTNCCILQMESIFSRPNALLSFISKIFSSNPGPKDIEKHVDLVVSIICKVTSKNSRVLESFYHQAGLILLNENIEERERYLGTILTVLEFNRISRFPDSALVVWPIVNESFSLMTDSVSFQSFGDFLKQAVLAKGILDAMKWYSKRNLQYFTQIEHLISLTFLLSLTIEEYSHKKVMECSLAKELHCLRQKTNAVLDAMLKFAAGELADVKEESKWVKYWSKLLNYNSSTHYRLDDSKNGFVSEPSADLDYEVISKRCETFSRWLLNHDDRIVKYELFYELLTCDRVESESQEEQTNEQLLTKDSDKGRMIPIKLLEFLGNDESLMEGCWERVSDELDSLKLLRKILQRLVREIELKPKEFTFTTTLSYVCMGIQAVAEIVKFQETNQRQQFREELKKCVPLLRVIVKKLDSNLQNMGTNLEDLIVYIETGGYAGDLEKIESKQKAQSEFEMELNNAQSACVATKGHSLLRLRKMFTSNNPEAHEYSSLLLDVFLKELEHEDSYVYLMAIEGLAALSKKYHDKVIPVIISQYEDFKRDDIEFRIKVGEVLVRVIKYLGDIAPLYRLELTNLLFRLVRDESNLVRASAFSNFAQFIDVLKFSAPVVLTQLWHCVEDVLDAEDSSEVKAAASHLLVMALRSIASNFSNEDIHKNEASLGSFLRDVRRKIVLKYNVETNMSTKTQMSLALEEIDMIAKKLFIVPRSLEYKIRILE